MKIDATTIAVLKNFAKINPSILIQEGNVLKTMSTNKTIMAKATVSTTFPTRCAIYDVDKFLASFSLYNNEPDLNFLANKVILTSEGKNGQCTYADESNITKAPDKELTLPSVDASFRLTNANLKDIERALGILGVNDIVFAGNGEDISIQAYDIKNPTSDNFSIKIGTTDKTFKAIFKSENIKIIPGDYDVEISARGISRFTGKEAEYWIAVESTSTF
jgi:hypothetical protein